MNLKLMTMKKIFKISLVLVGLVSTLNASAGNSILTLDLKKVDGKKVSFTLNEMDKVKLSIYDNNDDLIFKENLSGKQSYRTYDLAALPKGVYFIEAESDLKISKYKVEVTDKVAKLSPVAVSEVFKPVFDYQTENKKLSINIENSLKTLISVEVYNGLKELVYSKTSASNEFIKTFNLNKFEDKECTFVVSYSGKTFENTIQL
jgi:hypothetical protein